MSKAIRKSFLGKVLMGDLKGYFSIRLSYQDRIVYSLNHNEVEIYILRVKTHYGEVLAKFGVSEKKYEKSHFMLIF